jgi:integrase
VLNKAVDDEVIPANPAHKIGKLVRAKDSKEDMDPLSQEELKKLLDAVQKNKELKVHYPLFLLLARTGMRIGEALGLSWGDIDFNGRFIHVQRGVSRGRIELPKNSKTRKVNMSEQLTEALKVHLIESKKRDCPGIRGCT